jgi:hypothetical protein
MRRLFLYAVAVFLGGWSANIAWYWSDARVAFITIGVCFVGGLLWVAQGLPKIGRTDLLRSAMVLLLSSIVAAIVFPSTRVLCDCPMPQTGVRHCVCPIDHHLTIRVWIVVLGLLAAVVLAVRAHFEGIQAKTVASREPE